MLIKPGNWLSGFPGVRALQAQTCPEPQMHYLQKRKGNEEANEILLLVQNTHRESVTSENDSDISVVVSAVAAFIAVLH